MFVGYSPDGQRIALSTEAGAIYIFDVESGSLSATFSSHAMGVRTLAWSSDSQLLLSGSDDKRIVLHDVRTSSGGSRPGSGMVASLSGHSSWVLSVSLAADNRAVVSGSADRNIKVWDLAARSCVSTIQEQGEIWGVSWKPNVGFGTGAFVSPGNDGCVRFWRSAGAG